MIFVMLDHDFMIVEKDHICVASLEEFCFELIIWFNFVVVVFTRTNLSDESCSMGNACKWVESNLISISIGHHFFCFLTYSFADFLCVIKRRTREKSSATIQI